MKTIVCNSPNQLLVTERKRPAVKEGEALVKIHRIGVCGTDIHAYHGRQPFFSYPRVLGHELSGEIAELNEENQDLSLGDKVAIIPYLECGQCIACRKGKPNCCRNIQVLGVHTDGGMQEYISVPTSHLIKINQLSYDQAAIVECLSIGAHAVRRANIQRDEYVLVIGAGPIGLGIMQYAKLAGAKVIVMDMSMERLKFCQKWASPDYTVNAKENPEYDIAEITNGDYPTAVFDATGNINSMNNAYKYAAHGGSIIYVGLVQAELQFSDQEFHKRELTIYASRNATKEDFETVINSLEEGKIDIQPFITCNVSLESLPERFEDLTAPETGNIKIMIELP
ncbi:zinc-binding alcohol dehydrogenase family protein [Terribacillus aidingensis]|uniref:zinc-binding alcohol dehydrogenase family protein n=1 Tax=Terribacillus aidingensis TaxID=586416 RepID=UPI00344ED8EE